MKLPRYLLAAAAAVLLASPAPARGQGADARVLPRGFLELRGVGVFTTYDERWTDDGTEPLAASLFPAFQSIAERLTQPALGTLQTELDRFFAGTQGRAPGEVPEAVSAGAAFLGTAADERHVPFTLAYGLSRRLTVSLTAPIERRGTGVTGNYLRGGGVGLNPNTARNAQLFGRIGAEFAPLGTGRFLPVEGTDAADELQRRVQAILGDTVELVLPARPVSYQDLLAIPALAALLSPEDTTALGLVSARTPYRLGDVEIGARFLLRGQPLGFAGDSARGTRVRTAVEGRVRLPTGPRSNTLSLLEVPPQSGHLAFGADVVNDVYLGRRWWISAGAGAELALAADVERRGFGAERPFPDSTGVRTLRRAPGLRLQLALTPRYRLTREISLAGHYRFLSVGETEYTAQDDLGAVFLGPLETADAWTAHQLGLGASYSSLEAFAAGRTPLPFEAALLYRNTYYGTSRAPDAGSITVTGRVFYQLIGRPRRPRPAPADSAATRPPPPPSPPMPPVLAPPPGEPAPVPPPPPASRADILRG